MESDLFFLGTISVQGMLKCKKTVHLELVKIKDIFLTSFLGPFSLYMKVAWGCVYFVHHLWDRLGLEDPLMECLHLNLEQICSNNRIQTNYKGLKITSCMHVQSWQLWTKNKMQRASNQLLFLRYQEHKQSIAADPCTQHHQGQTNLLSHPSGRGGRPPKPTLWPNPSITFTLNPFGKTSLLSSKSKWGYLLLIFKKLLCDASWVPESCCIYLLVSSISIDYRVQGLCW